MIVEKAAALLNQQGYLVSSVYDVMKETGLEKGGIYYHFGGKEELALEAYRFARDLVGHEIKKALHSTDSSIGRLYALLEVFRNLAHGVPIKGGCPTMNVSIESDDAHPALCTEARNAMAWVYKTVKTVVLTGIEKQEFAPDCNPDQIASIFISTAEGALMLSKLFDDTTYMDRAILHLKSYLSSCTANLSKPQGGPS